MPVDSPPDSTARASTGTFNENENDCENVGQNLELKTFLIT